MKLAGSAKAIIAFFGPTVTAALGMIEEAIRTHHPIAWPIIGATALVSAWGAALVWAIPNTPPLDATQPIPVVKPEQPVNI